MQAKMLPLRDDRVLATWDVYDSPALTIAVAVAW